MKVAANRSQFKLQIEGVIFQLSVAMCDQLFLFLQFLVQVDVGDEAVVVDGIESNVNFPVEGVVAGEGGEGHGVSDEGRWVGSHERSGCKWPSIGDAIQAMATDVYIVAVVNIVMVKPDVMRITLCPILKGEFVAIFDVVMVTTTVHLTWAYGDAVKTCDLV